MVNKILINNIDDAVLKVIGSATDSKFIIKNNKGSDLITKLDTIQDTKFQSFLSNTFNKTNSHWNKIENVKLLRLEGDRGGSIRKAVKNKLPYKDYNLMKIETNKLANKVGFKNEEDFIKTIDDYLKLYKTDKSVLQEPKLLNFISFLRRHPKTVLVGITASSSIFAILNAISNIHKKNTGCFRYYKNVDDDDKPKIIKQKISGNFCISNKDDDDDTLLLLLPESEHPLFNKEKWDCNYKNFDLNGINGIKANEIFGLGCNGLCDPLNYNALAALTPEYEGITLSEKEHEKHDKYMYVCERASILREFTTNIFDSVNEIAQGVIQSQIGHKMYEYVDLMKKYILFIVVIILVLTFVIHRWILNNNNNKTNI